MERFGPYVLQALLGRGGMGEVFRAQDSRKHDRLVALKRLLRVYASDPLYEAQFRREAKLAAGLTNRNIIPIYDYGEEDGQLFLTMPLINGVDLATVLAEHGPLSPRRAVRIIGQMARALELTVLD